jgi:3-vinyl bacteriochlorophyllide hydratase
MLVLALHTLYLVAWLQNSLEVRALLFLALAAYAAYAINAMQFLLKLKAARRQSTAPVEAASPSGLLQSGDGA